jgi:hypothetical protein
MQVFLIAYVRALLLTRLQHCILCTSTHTSVILLDDVAEQGVSEATLFYVSCLTCSFHQSQVMI